MSTARMRRVDEAVRQVIGDAIAGELKDPRVGFVTVTDVQHQPRPAPRARVRERARRRRRAASEAEREATLDGPAQRPRLPAGPARRRAAPEAHPDARVRLRRHHRPRDARGAAARARSRARERAPSDRPRTPRARARADPRGPALHRSPRTRSPTATRSARWSAMHGLLTALGKDSVMFISPGDLPLPREYRCFALDGHDQRAARRTSRERTVVFLDCGNIDRNPAGRAARRRHLLNIDHHHDNTHFGTLNHVVPERLLHGRDRVGPDARAGVRADAGDRRGPVRRA